MTDRDTMPLRGVYAKVRVCCEEMQKALDVHTVVEGEWLRGVEAPSPYFRPDPDYDGGYYPLNYCWVCGKKLEVEPEMR